MMMRLLLVGLLAIFVPSLSRPSDDLDSLVYRCEGPSGELYTNKKGPGCIVMSLPELTIAPSRSAATPTTHVPSHGVRPFPSDWFDYDAPVGSLRNQLTLGGLYGTQEWLDYDAPIGSLRNSPAYWPSPYGLYGW
jgi:hypothetical protein